MHSGFSPLPRRLAFRYTWLRMYFPRSYVRLQKTPAISDDKGPSRSMGLKSATCLHGVVVDGLIARRLLSLSQLNSQQNCFVLFFNIYSSWPDLTVLRWWKYHETLPTGNQNYSFAIPAKGHLGTLARRKEMATWAAQIAQRGSKLVAQRSKRLTCTQIYHATTIPSTRCPKTQLLIIH